MRAYVYCAALYCEQCIANHVLGVPVSNVRIAIERERKRHGIPDGATDTDNVPDGPHAEGGGEADSPQHCDGCRVFLENPLTSDGQDYVRDAIREYNENGRGSRDVLQTWRDYYTDSVTRWGIMLPELKGD